MSRDIKRQSIWFQVDDSEAVAKHLEKMAAKGWLLDSVDNAAYVFRRSEPAAVKYAVTYFPEASVFDPGITEGQETYASYCEAAGWELAAVYGPVQYFRAARENPIPIETDEAVKLDAVRKTMRKTYVLSYTLLLLIPAVGLPLALSRFREDPIGFFSSAHDLALLGLLAAIAFFSVGMLVDYLIWVLRSRRSIARGGVCVKPHTRARLRVNMAMLALTAVALFVFIFARTGSQRFLYLMNTAVYLSILPVSRWVMKKLKKHSENRSSVVAGYLCYAIAAAVAVTLFGVFGMIPLLRSFTPPQETYTSVYPNGGTIAWTVSHDELPVTLEDLGFPVTSEDHCSYKADVQRTPLAFFGKYTQQVLNPDSELDDLRYQVYQTSWPWLMEKSWDALIADEIDSPFPLEKLASAPWGAEAAYKQRDLEGYYLCWPDMALYVRFSGEAEREKIDRLVQILRDA